MPEQPDHADKMARLDAEQPPYQPWNRLEPDHLDDMYADTTEDE